MKIQIDTTAKTIQVEPRVKLGQLFEMFEQLLPGGLWKEYTLCETAITWNPCPLPIIKYREHAPYIHNPVTDFPWITYSSGTLPRDCSIQRDKIEFGTIPGVYSIEFIENL